MENNAESGSDNKESVQPLLEKIDHFKRKIIYKNSIISLLIKTEKSHLADNHNNNNNNNNNNN